MASESFLSFLDTANKLCKSSEADALLLLLEGPVDWKVTAKKAQGRLLVASHNAELIQLAEEAEIEAVHIDMPEATVQERLSQAILASVAAEMIPTGGTVVTLYSGFDTEEIDTVSVLKLTERLGRLTARDLRKLETKVPLETLKVVVDLAVDIGREGREGKPVGTMFIVGDHRKVLEQSRPGGFDFVKGYQRKERNLNDSRVREGIREIAQLDGMFIVSADGTVEASARIIDTPQVELTMTTGLGSRHYSGAAISKNTKAIAVVVSESSGTVRIFQNGEVVLRIEPFRRAMKWKNLKGEASAAPTGEP
jgi:DNA integrity scanning protein DisA with diadenylate cyclase activity